LLWQQWLLWTMSTGLGLYVALRLGVLSGVFAADRTGICIGLALLYGCASTYAGRRSLWISRQSVQALAQCSDSRCSERMRGPHEALWFASAMALRLGLLGTVIGFIAMLASLRSLPESIAAMAPQLIEDMGQGMAIALSTTLIGLLASLGLAAQTLLLDRAADELMARAAELRT
jgi:biopolymer transport protein ExbB/TolQ